MEKRTLGRTGLNVAVVGFGTLPMGGFYGPVDDTVSRKALHTAIDAGIILSIPQIPKALDTASTSLVPSSKSVRTAIRSSYAPKVVIT